LNAKYPSILLLFILIASLAGAAPDPVTRTENYLKILAEAESSNESLLVAQEQFIADLNRLISLQEKDFSDRRFFSENLTVFDSEIIPIKESNKNEVYKYNSSIQFYDVDRYDSGRSNGYLSKIDNNELGRKKLGGDLGTSTVGLKYIYEKDKTTQDAIDFGFQFRKPDDDLQITFQDRSIAERSQDWIKDSVPHFEDIKEKNELKTITSLRSRVSGGEPYFELLGATIGEAPFAMRGQADEPSSPAPDSVGSYHINSFSATDFTYIPEKLPNLKKETRNSKNYAIIVGIDEYKDRMSLHTCANDAKSVADLMSSLGYTVVLLSDQTERKPTKRNILDLALNEIKDKPELGNVIFYFSGHGTRANNDTFYLIPQDADGSASSYISEYELRQQIKDFKNLAVIIDACNSEGMSPAIGEGQLIIASSRYNESSNEEWTGSLSVFTSNLIKAIKEERARSKKVLLQECFDKAYNDTIKWSRGRFISQTPVLTDLTGGKYYIN
jgi:hypothetical protein